VTSLCGTCPTGCSRFAFYPDDAMTENHSDIQDSRRDRIRKSEVSAKVSIHVLTSVISVISHITTVISVRVDIHCVSKNATTLVICSFDKYGLILTILGK